MSLLITACAPCSLLLHKVNVQSMLQGWKLVGSTADHSLSAGPVTMRKGDVHSVSFYLVPPTARQLAPPGSVAIEWQRGPVATDADSPTLGSYGAAETSGHSATPGTLLSVLCFQK